MCTGLKVGLISDIPLLVFCLLDLSVCDSGDLMCPTIILLMFI